MFSPSFPAETDISLPIIIAILLANGTLSTVAINIAKLKTPTSSKERNAIHIPIIVRLQGTNADLAKEIIDNSGLDVQSAVEFEEAAQKVQKVLAS